MPDDDERGHDADGDTTMQCEQGTDLLFCGCNVDMIIQDGKVDAVIGKRGNEQLQESSALMFCDNTEPEEWPDPDPWWSWDWNEEDWEDLDLELKVPSTLVAEAIRAELDQPNKFGT